MSLQSSLPQCFEALTTVKRDENLANAKTITTIAVVGKDPVMLITHLGSEDHRQGTKS